MLVFLSFYMSLCIVIRIGTKTKGKKIENTIIESASTRTIFYANYSDFSINLILFFPLYIHRYSVGALKYSFPLISLTLLAYIQYGCAKILTHFINPIKSCKEINPKKINPGSPSIVSRNVSIRKRQKKNINIH